MELQDAAAREAHDDETGAARPAGWLDQLSAPRTASGVLLALGALLFLWNLGGYPLYTKGEPREAVTIFDMVHGGGVILPMRAGVEIPSKPLLMHWCAAAISLAFGGVSEWTVRLPSAIFAIVGLLACYFYVRRLYDQRIGLIAAIILGTTFQYLQAGSGARVDMTLTLFLEIAFFEFILIAEDLTSRRMLLYLAIAFAVLSKGPVGIVLPALVGLIWIVLMRRWDLLRKLRPIRGALLVAIIGGGWYVAAFWIGGADFFRKQIIAENFVRFTGGPGFHEGHAHPFFYVELALLAGFMPWTVLLPTVAAVAAWRPMKVTPRLAYLMVWFATVLIFYNLAHSKRGVYLLALYPALATIIAVYLADVLADSAPFRRVISITSGVAEVALIALGVSGLIGLATLVAMPSAMHEFLKLFAIDAPMFVPMLASSVHQHWMLAAALPLACEALGLLLAHHHQSLERVLAVTTGAVICVGIAANLIVVPAMADTLALKDFAHDVLNKVGSSRLGYLGALNYDFAFYSGGTYPIVRARDAELPDYLLAWDSIFASLPLEQRAKFTVVIESNPTSLDGSDQLMLLRRGAPPATPAGPPKGELETRYDSDDFRRSAIAVTSLGRTFADPPRRLKSQILVISDS